MPVTKFALVSKFVAGGLGAHGWKVARGFRAFCFRGFGGMALNLSLESIALSFRPGVCVTVILEI